jgi:hypothetical protein
MYQHVILLFSFIFAIALTHLFASTTALALARHRVRFSGLLSVWMFNAAGQLLGLWVSLFTLVAVKR